MTHSEEAIQQEKISKELAKVFSDTESHLAIARLIRDHLSNPTDIRQTALHSINPKNQVNMLDVGCGFGYFTRGLKGKIPFGSRITGIDLHAAYHDHYLDSCAHAGLEGNFLAGGIDAIDTLQEESFDMVLSSYSLYFFPGYIKNIARILKPGGKLIAITHAVPHMQEFTRFVKNILREERIKIQAALPYESLIGNFSNENGLELLSPWFKKINCYKYKSALVFQSGDLESLHNYFRFKHTFFLPENNYDRNRIFNLILDRIEEEMKIQGRFTITKNDIIFNCGDKR